MALHLPSRNGINPSEGCFFRPGRGLRDRFGRCARRRIKWCGSHLRVAVAELLLARVFVEVSVGIGVAPNRQAFWGPLCYSFRGSSKVWSLLLRHCWVLRGGDGDREPHGHGPDVARGFGIFHLPSGPQLSRYDRVLYDSARRGLAACAADRCCSLLDFSARICFGSWGVDIGI